MEQGSAIPKSHVAVIGGGIIGATTALELVERGHRVTLLEPGTPGGPQAASYGNGAFLSPASVIPMSVPGLWRKVPGFLVDRNGPLSIAPLSLPRLAPWLLRFLLAGCTPARMRRIATALNALICDAPQRHADLAARIGRPDLIRRDGLLYAFPDRDAFAAEAGSWALRRDLGIAWQELDGPALRQLEPGLSPRYGFGVLVPSGGQCTDPGAYTAAIVAHAETLGLTRLTQRATGLEIRAGRIAGLVHEGGTLACDAVVLAAGVRSAMLAKQAGDRVPLEAERGYHVEIDAPTVTIGRPIMPSDGKMANTMVAGRLRASGQVELSSTDAAPNWNRAAVLLKHLKATYPELEIPAEVRRWQGNRPSTPDGLPVIGAASRCAGLIHAFGHGHVGLNAAPATARLVADLLEGRPPEVDPAPYRAARF
ncbi:FAD-dependent oxidoreductase [Pseudooceanicola sp. GBMRC 2024]|uniref:FAD-dependent oxidoreductase n=1 Tax=Pseudooceanicola albus TaxID=2692189 RepID=A0A6L7G5E9_9RHOB|nr:FAD-binding oxidoreductase [Pseudooceanicola albus]MXN17883.1 FAD-dependent oxidoreductase [Pseudooceanicola albus]